MAGLIRVVNGGALVTRCAAPTTVTLDASLIDAGSATTLRWTGAAGGAGNPIKGYEIWRATGGDFSYLQTVEATGTSGSASVTASTTMGGKHYYRVKTLGRITGFESKISTNEAALTAQTYSAVKAPTAVSVSANNVGFGQSVTLSWSGAGAGTNNPITGYEIWRSTSADGTYSRLTSVTTGAASGSVAVTSPGNNSSYYYKVKTLGTKSGFADSGLSVHYAALTSKVTAVGVPTAVSVSANNVGFGASVTLRWSGATAGTNNAIKGYEIHRCTVAGGAYSRLTSVTTTATSGSVAVTAPGSNASYWYIVKTLGSVSGYDSGTSSAYATLTSKVTAPTAPASVWLSAADVRIGKSVTLSWSGAANGTNNAIAKYHVYRNGAYLTETTATSCSVTASGTAGAVYTYTVYSIGSVSGWNSGASGGVNLTAHGAESVISYYTSSGSYTVPSWAQRVDVSCIGGGGGGAGASYSYKMYGGGGGGSGWIGHANSVVASPGQVLSITVGAGGAAGANETSGNNGTNGGNGGTSSVYRSGTALREVGGGGGGIAAKDGNANGGWGGAGGGGGGAGVNGGSRRSGAGGTGQGTTGGGHAQGSYGVLGGGGGSYKGTNGGNGNPNNWCVYTANGGVGANTNEYYCFNDKSSGRYLNAIGGDGGPGHGAETAGRGGQGGQVGKDGSGAALVGTGYGRGGNGGGQEGSGSSSGTVHIPAAGQSGLVAVRAWRYLS